MGLGREDVVASTLMAVILGAYIAFLATGDVPERGMALIGLVLGWLIYLASSRRIPRTDRWTRFARVGGFVSLGLGLAALVSGLGGLLAVFLASIVALWALVILRNAGALPGTGAQQMGSTDDHDPRPPPVTPSEPYGPLPPPPGGWGSGR
jgi:hypothetical protein